MNIYYSVLVAVLTLIFFIILIYAVRFKSYSFKTVRTKNDKNIEVKLRLLMRKNPRSEIVVIDSSTLSETSDILRKMQYDFPEIHIISY